MAISHVECGSTTGVVLSPQVAVALRLAYLERRRRCTSRLGYLATRESFFEESREGYLLKLCRSRLHPAQPQLFSLSAYAVHTYFLLHRSTKHLQHPPAHPDESKTTTSPSGSVVGPVVGGCQRSRVQDEQLVQWYYCQRNYDFKASRGSFRHNSHSSR